jgi:hypothetical protein
MAADLHDDAGSAGTECGPKGVAEREQQRKPIPGASLRAKLKAYCDGTRFRYAFA